MRLEIDTAANFPCFIVKGRCKSEKRRFLALACLDWLKFCKQHLHCQGAIMVDIDDTLVDGNQNIKNGFEFMKLMMDDTSLNFPIHIVTARPLEQHKYVMRMLQDRKICIPPDRLHMLPSHLWGKGDAHVEKFKWETFVLISKLHKGVAARFGDRLWDVAHIDALKTYQKHISEKDCCLFIDPKLRGTMSAKLPGADP